MSPDRTDIAIVGVPGISERPSTTAVRRAGRRHTASDHAAADFAAHDLVNVADPPSRSGQQF